MANGAVPVVLNNDVERSIVEHMKTGLVVDSPTSFNEAINYLLNHPEHRAQMSKRAREEVVSRFSLEASVHQLNDVYQRLSHYPKRSYNFQALMGNTPGEWFQFGLGWLSELLDGAAASEFMEQRWQHPVLYERTKSSAFHFLSYYPDDEQLVKWTQLLLQDKMAHGKADPSKQIEHNE